MPDPLNNFPVITRIETPKDIDFELQRIGCDKDGIKIMQDKAILLNVKLKRLTPTQANILKQAMLSIGGDAGCARGTINSTVKFTDMVLMGTVSQLKNLIKKLKSNHFSLPAVSEQINTAINNYLSVPHPIKVGKKTLDFKRRTYIMGIVNVTPDSFSDGGKFYNPKKAIEHANKLIDEGADIIDIGGESTRPGAKAVQADEETRRILPVVLALAKHKNILISVDTRKSKVAEAALKSGAHIINDVSALRHDKNMAKVIAKYKAAAVLMHMQGTPADMQDNPKYNDLISDMLADLQASVEIAKKSGILTERIIIDPGIGFGKNLGHNLNIIQRLKEFKALGLPILAGISRKSMIGKILGIPPDQRLAGSIAATVLAIYNGANIIRVHDVFEMKQAAKIVDAIRTGGRQ